MFYGVCTYDGFSGSGAHVEAGATLRWSGETFYGPPSATGTGCFGGPGTGIVVHPGGTQVHPTSDDPLLSVSGIPTAGSPVQFLLEAPAGATAVLYFGRSALLVPTPNVVIEQLTQRARTVNLGTIPASQQATFTWPIAAALPAGTRLFAQAEITLPGGEVRRTNSVPVIVR